MEVKLCMRVSWLVCMLSRILEVAFCMLRIVVVSWALSSRAALSSGEDIVLGGCDLELDGPVCSDCSTDCCQGSDEDVER